MPVCAPVSRTRIARTAASRGHAPAGRQHLRSLRRDARSHPPDEHREHSLCPPSEKSTAVKPLYAPLLRYAANSAEARPGRRRFRGQCRSGRPLPVDFGARLFLSFQPAHAVLAARPRSRRPGASEQRRQHVVDMVLSYLHASLRRRPVASGERRRPSQSSKGESRMMREIVDIAAACGAACQRLPRTLPSAQDKLSVRLDFSPWGVQAAMHLAKNKGWFKDAGLDVDIQDGRGSGNTIQLVNAGQVDVGQVQVGLVGIGARARRHDQLDRRPSSARPTCASSSTRTRPMPRSPISRARPSWCLPRARGLPSSTLSEVWRPDSR